MSSVRAPERALATRRMCSGLPWWLRWERIHLPMRETWVQALGREDPLEEGMQPTAVFLPGESHGQRSLVGCRLCMGLQRGGHARATDTHRDLHVVKLRGVAALLYRSQGT